MSYIKLIKKIEYIFEDEELVVVSKPSGLLSIADRNKLSPNLKDVLLKKYGEIYTVHRLDKETSGIMIFARNLNTHKFLNRQFSDRLVNKVYWAFVQNSPSYDSGEVDMPIHNDMRKSGRMLIHKEGKPAQTKFKLLKNYGKVSLMAFSPITGRTHQIRVHSKYLSCPLLVDEIYAKKNNFYLSEVKRVYKKSVDEEEKPFIKRLTLHAKTIEFTHPKGEKMFFECELPKELKALQNQLEKLSK